MPLGKPNTYDDAPPGYNNSQALPEPSRAYTTGPPVPYNHQDPYYSPSPGGAQGYYGPPANGYYGPPANGYYGNQYGPPGGYGPQPGYGPPPPGMYYQQPAPGYFGDSRGYGPGGVGASAMTGLCAGLCASLCLLDLCLFC